MAGTKFLDRLRTHDWLGALIELVIVIAGILIALQVSNWNQDRADRTRGSRFAHRLVAELASDQRGADVVGMAAQRGAGESKF